MDSYLKMGSDALKKAALNEQAKAYLMENEALFRVVKRAADRYIGGESLEETVPKVIEGNRKGLKCSIEFMGESTSTAAEAHAATDEFVRIADVIHGRQLQSTISLDLSHIGLALSADLCRENLAAICNKANDHAIEVIVSAEGPDRTDQVIDTYRWASTRFSNVSITVQAYLHRTREDFADLIQLPGRIRMVKGAFDAPGNVAMSRGDELNAVYLSYVESLLASNHRCAIATHDATIQDEVRTLIERHQPDRDTYEFESLYGIRNDALDTLHRDGYPAKLYFVYGREWYLYLCNRIAEYPLNLFRAIHDMVE